MHVTYRYRVKSKLGRLNKAARAVNFVWNYCNDAQKHALKHSAKWPSGYTLGRLTAGSSRELNISAATIERACIRFEQSRRLARKPYLRYRGRKSLGWIPFRPSGISIRGGKVIYFGAAYRLALSRTIPDGAKICDGSSFAQDARGHWYLNLVLELPDIALRETRRAVGIDLGLKTLATLSTGAKIEAPRLYRASEKRLARAQRARKKALARRINSKIERQRRDFLHKASTDIVRTFDVIYAGNVNAAGLAKAPMAKSIFDAGWSTFRKQLAYKSIANGATYREVDEAYSTQACSDCGVIGGPKGRQGLVIREWRCECGTVHDRDVNAARNILRAGHRSPIAGAVAA